MSSPRKAALTHGAATSPFADLVDSNSALRTFLHGLPGVDQVGAQQRAAALASRSIKAAAKSDAIDLAISMIDLTRLEGADTPGKVQSLALKRAARMPQIRARHRSPRCAFTATWCSMRASRWLTLESGSPRSPQLFPRAGPRKQ